MTYPPQPGQYPQNPYGQQPYGGQPGYPGGGPPSSNRGVLIAIIVVAAVLVLGGGGVTLWLLNKDDSASEQTTTRPSDPTTEDSPTDEPNGRDIEAEVTAIAQRYADAINNVDEATATESMCDKADPGTLYKTIAGQVKVDIDNVDIDGDEASVDFIVRDAGDHPVQLYFELKNDAWCVSF